MIRRYRNDRCYCFHHPNPTDLATLEPKQKKFLEMRFF